MLSQAGTSAWLVSGPGLPIVMIKQSSSVHPSKWRQKLKPHAYVRACSRAPRLNGIVLEMCYPHEVEGPQVELLRKSWCGAQPDPDQAEATSIWPWVLENLQITSEGPTGTEPELPTAETSASHPSWFGLHPSLSLVSLSSFLPGFPRLTF